MPSYSVNLNAVVAQAATAVTRLQVVCAYGGSDTQVCVATAANLALAGGRLRGVALENQAAGFPIQIIDYGSVNATMVGTGPYVNYDASGNLALSTTSGTNTVGTYENGVIHVNLDFTSTGGNATAIQGIPVTSAGATKSWILAGDGTALRSRKDIPNTRDYGMAADGVTSDRAKFVSFFADVGTYGAGIIHQPASGGFLIDGFPLELHDDTATGNLRGFRLIGELADPFNPGGHPTFLNNVACPNGSAATINAYGNGGSGQNMQTLTGLSGVLASDADHYVGRPIRIRGADTKAHNGEFFITSVPADGSVTIYQPNTGAGGTDLNSGAIRWKIYMPMLDIRAREWRIDGLSFYAKSNAGKLGPLLEIGQPYRAGALSSINWAVHHCAFASGSSASLSRYGVQIAKQIVPRSGHPSYSVNGAGVPQVINTSQVDTGDFYRCSFSGMDEMGVCHSSPSAQSKEVTFRKCQFAPSSRNIAGFGGIGYGVARNGFVAGGSYATEGSPGANFHDCSFGALNTGVLLGGGSSMPVDFHSCYWESTQRPVRAFAVAAPRPINFFGCGIAPTTTQPHPSREWMEIGGGDGPVNFFGTNIQLADSSGYHAVFNGSANESKVGLFGVWLKGSPGWAGYRARVSARLCGPYCFDSGDTLVFAVDGGANQTVTITVANFTTAGVSGVDLTEVESWQLGQLINYYVTGSAAWGEYDNAPVIVESATEGGASRIEYKSATGKAAYLDFPTGVQTGATASVMATTSLGWFATARVSGTIAMAITSHGVLAASYTTATPYAWWEGTKRFGTVYKNDITGPSTGTFTAVTGGIVTVAGAVVTIADNRVTANSVVHLIPTNAAAVTLGAWYLSARTLDTSFAVTFGGAPAGTETFIYTISEPT